MKMTNGVFCIAGGGGRARMLMKFVWNPCSPQHIYVGGTRLDGDTPEESDSRTQVEEMRQPFNADLCRLAP